MGRLDDRYFILDDQHNIVAVDVTEWSQWLGASQAKRIVAKTKIKYTDLVVSATAKLTGEEEVEVSTVFLGLNHSWGDGPPQLFETMVFDGKMHREQDHYATWQEAEEGHLKMVERVRSGEVAE